MTNILDRMAPVKTFQLRNKYAAWIGDTTKNLIKERNAAQDLAAQSGTKDDWEEYKVKRNKVTALLVKDKLFWQKKKLENCEEVQDTGKL